LCIACATDGHNWIIPNDVSVIDSETNENWQWFMERLKEGSGTPPSLTFCIDYGLSVMHEVGEVFSYAEHRERMQSRGHLWKAQ
jgi:zinc finger SWIM domain-containing protein 3